MKSIAAILFGIALINLPAFAAPDLSKLPPASDKTGLTYAKDIRPMLEASCFRCHGEERQRGGLRLDTLEAMLKGGDEGKILMAGKSKESALVISVAQIDDETAMPPKRGGGGGPGGQRGPGGPGGFGGQGGGGGRGPGGMLAPQMVAQGDKDGDKKLSKDEFTTLADAWFDKLDTEKSGKVSQEQFVERFGSVLPPPGDGRAGDGRSVGGPGGGGFGGGKGPGGQSGGQPGGAPQGGGQPGQPGGGRGDFGPGRFVGPGLFTATDTDKDGSLTRKEFKGEFAKWFAEWDAEKSGAIDEAKISTGLGFVLPRPSFGGPGGPGQVAGGPGGPGGGFGGGKGPGGPGGQGGFGGQQSKPLTAEQVGLVRAWIDQGAK